MNFKDKKEEFFDRLGESCYMVLASCLNDYPMASMMTCLVYDGAIWVQTDKNFPKYQQISHNPKVALCKDATQIEGEAVFCGSPLDESNAKFARLLQKYHRESFEMYSKVPTEVVIKIRPTKVTDWLYEAGSSEIIHLNFENETVLVEQYKNSK
ncbi:MAG: pyridoxamine 5'-phosphate oxidase family protein [Oscillospiraceae bacterium]